MENADYFKSLIGEQLSSVEFVQDYLQLHFDGNTLTFYSWPIVTLNEKQYMVGDLDYRNKLCSIIGKKVTKVMLDDKVEVEIFIDDAIIILPLLRDSSNKDIPEFMYYRDVNKNWLVLD